MPFARMASSYLYQEEIMFRVQSALKFTICLMSVLAIVLFPFIGKADAHAYSASYTTIELTKANTEMTYALDELSVIELVGGDTNKNGMLEQEEFDQVKDRLVSLLQQNIIFKLNNQPQHWQIHSLILDRQGDATKATLKVSYAAVSTAQPVSLTDHLYMNDAAANYVDLVTIHYGKQKSTAALSGKNRVWAMQMTETEYAGMQQDKQSQVSAATSSSEEPQAAASNRSEQPDPGWFSFFMLGINHILSGYDHLLFLFSLLIARQTFKQYAAMITAFTIAHSITLTLTVLGWINMPAAIVEPAIALSICYVAVENMLSKRITYRWLLTFLFGLVHGMGFADILKEMDIPGGELAADLISFNVGIEVVQVTLVAILLPLLVIVHRWEHSKRVVLASSAAAFAMGGIWLAERIFN
ncbi:HupE/UreJ family protein [Paenibacillus piri]|uniref:HupE/UreJ family protein n=1 Tax=Paenibacillus piri TaxID=2547395 RepID=A0A4R5K7I4_9BACL|nr:HupE/UreJ family protein [Paenibacillus piri]TDF88357.1 HupE/UreJ family protein [Paenibacillus piri]